MKRSVTTLLAAIVTVVLAAGPALACGGLLAPNGTISLLRTATMAAYVDGVEHYVTSFEFAGGGAEVGSVVPLPGIPSDVKRGGDWTLQRLQQEVQPVDRRANLLAFGATTADGKAEVILDTKVDALDITILKGGGDEVGVWAKENGFQLPPDAPEVLDFYAERSPIFMAARFDVRRAQKLGRGIGDGIPIHLAIPTPNPWVPLRILGLGREDQEIVEADLFLLTEARPTLLPGPGYNEGITLERSEAASETLLADLRSDKGMKWMPRRGMHLSYLKIDAEAGTLKHDLAIDHTGIGIPSHVAAGLDRPTSPWPHASEVPGALWATALALAAGGLAVFLRGIAAQQ